MNQDAHDPADPSEEEIGAVLDRFEEAWQEGTVPNLETFLPTAVLAGSRQELLGELVKLDLEFRWRQKQSSRAGDTQVQPGKEEQETLRRKFQKAKRRLKDMAAHVLISPCLEIKRLCSFVLDIFQLSKVTRSTSG